MPQHHPIATWSPERDLWEGEEDIFGHSVVFSETLPKRGMTVGGRLFELPMSEPRTTGRGCSSSPTLPTPTAREGKTSDTEVEWGRHSPALGAVSHHFPTPKAHDGEFGMPRTSGRPIEKSTHLQTIVAHHFPTPRTTDANGAGRHGTGGADLRTVVTETWTGESTVPRSSGGSD